MERRYYLYCRPRDVFNQNYSRTTKRQAKKYACSKARKGETTQLSPLPPPFAPLNLSMKILNYSKVIVFYLYYMVCVRPIYRCSCLSVGVNTSIVWKKLIEHDRKKWIEVYIILICNHCYSLTFTRTGFSEGTGGVLD